MKAVDHCLNCGRPIPCRVGRGLCRGCWNDRAVRERFPRLAPFAGQNPYGTRSAGVRLSICERCELPIVGGYAIVNGDTICEGCCDRLPTAAACC